MLLLLAVLGGIVEVALVGVQGIDAGDIVGTMGGDADVVSDVLNLIVDVCRVSALQELLLVVEVIGILAIANHVVAECTIALLLLLLLLLLLFLD